MSRTAELVGGYWDGKVIGVPIHEPDQLIMPMFDTEFRKLTYERQINGKYKIKEEDNV